MAWRIRRGGWEDWGVQRTGPWNIKQGGGKEKNILLSTCFVSGTVYIISPSNFETRTGGVRRRMWKKGGCHWGGRTVPPGKESPQL